jgi:predicted transcriptional regulator
MDETENLISLTADIVASYVANNPVPAIELPNLISAVHAALLGTQVPAEAAGAEHTPVVSVKASIKPDHLVCLECGAKQKTLKRHLMTSHGLTPEAYRDRYSLPASYPLVAPEYAKQRSRLAKKIGLGRKMA